MKLKFFSTALAALLMLSWTPAAYAVTQVECSEEILFRFFPKQFVVDALVSVNVPKEQAEKIGEILATKDRDIVQMIEERASKMTPNPLQDQTATEARSQLFKGTISDVFGDVLAQNGVADKDQAAKALLAIQDMRVKRFEECRNAGLIPSIPAPQSSQPKVPAEMPKAPLEMPKAPAEMPTAPKPEPVK